MAKDSFGEKNEGKRDVVIAFRICLSGYREQCK